MSCRALLSGGCGAVTRRARVLLVALAGFPALLIGPLAGCGGAGPVTVTGAPRPTGDDLVACEALTAALPASLGEDLDRRDVEPPLATAAAYGAGPIVLTCGATGVAAGYRPDSLLSEVDEVGWFAEDLGNGQVRYSTPTRRPQVVLTLPADRQAFEIFVALAPTIRAHTRSTTG